MITRVLLERLQLYLGVPWRHKIEVAMKLDDENILRMADKRVRPRNLSQTQTKAVTSSRNNWVDLETWANWIVISMMKFIVAFQFWIQKILVYQAQTKSALSKRFSLWGHKKACNELIITYLDKTNQNVTYHHVSQSLCQFIESWCR